MVMGTHSKDYTSLHAEFFLMRSTNGCKEFVIEYSIHTGQVLGGPHFGWCS